MDLGGADGLIHISEMSWSMVESPEDLVKVGEELDVYVLRIDRETMKIALSLRRLQPEPWETIFERYQVGDVVDATVTKIANFGAFARLEDSIEGLIHITELSDAVITNPNEVVSEGQEIKVKILKIEMDRKRLGLSLKQTVEGLDSAGYVSEAPLESDSIGVDTEDPDGEEDGNSLAASAATTEAEETVEVEEIETEVSGVAEVDTDATDEGQNDKGQDESEDPPIEKEE